MWADREIKIKNRRMAQNAGKSMNINDAFRNAPAKPYNVSAPNSEKPPISDFRVTNPQGDTFLFSTDDLNSKGKLPIILTSLSGDDKKKISKMLREQFKGKITSELPLVNGFTAEIDPKKLKLFLKLVPKEVGVTIDSKLNYPDPEAYFPESIKGPEQAINDGNAYNETLGLSKLWEKGYTGKGVGVCVIDSGIFPHEDFDGRLVGWKDITPENKKDYYDPFGHGTHVSGIVGGSGKASDGKVKGVAPQANLIGVRITSVSEAIKGLQWAMENKEKYGIKVINMSLGDYAIKSYKDDPWAQAAEKAVNSGMVVVVAAGNEGPGESTISTPGTDPYVITVGNIDDRKTVKTDDDIIAENSSRGPTSVDKLEKPDILAPGTNIFAPLSPGSRLDIAQIPHIKDKYISFSGTSMATPIVAGVCALLLQANPNLTNEQIKEILKQTADPLPGLEANTQGKGRVDPFEAMTKVESMVSKALALKDPAVTEKPAVALKTDEVPKKAEVAAKSAGGIMLTEEKWLIA